VVFIRRNNGDTPLALVVLGLLTFSAIALALAVWVWVDLEGDLMTPITDGRWSGLPIGLLVLPIAAVGIAPIGFLVWMAIAFNRPADGRRPQKRRGHRR